MAQKISTKKRHKSDVPSVVRGIKKVEDLDENHVVLLYGKSGRGKTKTAASFPAPVLFIDINNEKGLKTVKKVKGVMFARVRTWKDFEDLYWHLRDDGPEYKTIVLDQITGLQDLCMKNVRKHFKLDDDEPFEGFKKWGKLSGDLKQWLSSYRELSDLYNIVFIAHERAFDEGGESDDMDPSVGARVVPSVGDFVAGACDIIGQSFIRSRKEKNEKGKTISKPEYCLRVGPHPIYTTKIRRPAEAGPLPEYVVDPTYQKLVAIEAGEVVNNVVKEKKHGKKQKVR